MRLIDADMLRKHIISFTGMFTDELGFVVSMDAVLGAIDFAQTVDAVKVVRCKDCVLWQRVDKYTGKCPLLIGELQYTGDDYYCSCGERKEENAAY